MLEIKLDDSFKKKFLGTFPLSKIRSALQKNKANDIKVKKFVTEYNDHYFKMLNVTRSQCDIKFKETMVKCDLPIKTGESFHRMAFTALAVSGFKPKNILELGTNKGETTAFLACLFPDAKIYTVELPENDPICAGRTDFNYDKMNQQLKKNTSYPNVVPLRSNTAFLMDLKLPSLDLIWLDAGHQYPEVAWDHFYCIQQLHTGGWLFSDDYIQPKNNGPKKPIHEVVEYFSERMPEKFKLIIKRENVLEFVKRPKYLAFYHKN